MFIKLSVLITLSCVLPLAADLPEVARRVNARLVKVYGSGGFRGIPAYGTGVVISPDGFVLTAAGPMLDTPELRVHLADGRRCNAKLVASEPALDLALIRVDNVEALPFFNVVEAANQPPPQTGDGILAFSNFFEIATRDEPVSVQQGVIAAVARLPLQRGLFAASYAGEVLVLDTVSNNPGAAGGALTTRDGRLLGVIGKELRNPLTDTWVNYAVPLTASVEVRQGDAVRKVTLVEFVERGIAGNYKPTMKPERPRDREEVVTGIVFVPNVVERTPPYVESVRPNSPAAKAGLKPDDLIAYIDGDPVISISVFHDLMSRARPGTPVKLEVRRGERLLTVELSPEWPMKK